MLEQITHDLCFAKLTIVVFDIFDIFNLFNKVKMFLPDDNTYGHDFYQTYRYPAL